MVCTKFEKRTLYWGYIETRDVLFVKDDDSLKESCRY